MAVKSNFIWKWPFALIGWIEMRRGAGIGGLQKQTATKDAIREVGNAVASTQLGQLKSQFSTFKTGLEEFSKKHQKDIAKNPMLRAHFQKMCGAIGVDPLVSSKGFWAEILGVGIGDFYYELGIQIVESCLLTQEQTGGLTDVSIIKKRVQRLRRTEIPIVDEDFSRAIDTLKPLGSGYKIIDLGERKVVQSVPMELSVDGNTLLKRGESKGYIAADSFVDFEWVEERFNRAANTLISEGLIWIDEQISPKLLWFPCFFKDFE